MKLISDDEILKAINKYPVDSHDDRWRISDRELQMLFRTAQAQLASCEQQAEEQLKAEKEKCFRDGYQLAYEHAEVELRQVIEEKIWSSHYILPDNKPKVLNGLNQYWKGKGIE